MEKEKSKGNMILYFFKMLGIFIVIDLVILMFLVSLFLPNYFQNQ